MTENCEECGKKVKGHWVHVHDPVFQEDIVCAECYEEMARDSGETTEDDEDWIWCDPTDEAESDDTQSADAVIFNQLKGGEQNGGHKHDGKS